MFKPRQTGFRRSTAPAVLAMGVGISFLFGCTKTEPVGQLLAEARALRDAGDYPAAVIKLNMALARDPKNLSARVLSSQLYIDLAQPDAGLGLIKRAEQDGAAELDIAKPRAEAELATQRYAAVINDTANLPGGASNAVRASLLAYRGAAFAALGKEAKAQEAMAQGLALDAHSIDVRVALARLSIIKGKFDAARRLLAEVRADAPKDRKVNHLEADIAYAARDYAEAERLYRKILEAEPWNQLALGDLAASQLALGKLSEAAANLDAILNDPDKADAPKDLILSHLRAVVAYRQSDYALAQAYSESVVARATNFEPARLLAAASSYALHEYERANYYISPYVSQNPDDRLARKLLAQIQLHLREPGEAVKTLSPVKEDAAGDIELLTLIGVASARNGDMAAAAHYLGLAVQQQPDDFLLRTELGKTEIALGDANTGITDLEQTVKAHPEELAPQIPLFIAYMKQKQYDKSLVLARNIIDIQPKSSTGYLLASSVYLIRGDMAAGRAALLKAREVHPGDVNADRNLARLALAEGRFDEAREYYREILSGNPKSVPTYIALADLEARAKRPNEAEAALLEAINANPEDLTATAVLARFELAQGKAQDALNRGQPALAKAPENTALLDVVGRAQLALGLRDDALSTFRDLVRFAPRAAWAHDDLAEAYLAKYTPETPQWPAINEATEAVALDPRDQAAKLILARALITHGRLVEAQKVVDALKTESVGDVAVAEFDGLIARGQGRLPDAAAAFARALAIEDTAADRGRLADVQHRLGHDDDAVRTLSDWLDAHPDDVESHKVLADLLVETGRYAKAADQFTELMRLEPNAPAAHNGMAWVLLRLGRADEAQAQAEHALALAPDSTDALDTMGAVLLAKGVPAEALEPLNKAWQNSSHRPEIGFHLSQALAATGKRPEALELLRQLLASDGAFDERTQAQQLLRQLGG